MSKTLVIGIVAVVALLALGSGVVWWQVFQDASVAEEHYEPDTALPEGEEEVVRPKGEKSATTEEKAQGLLLVQEQEVEASEVDVPKLYDFVMEVESSDIQEATFTALWDDASVIFMNLIAPDGTYMSSDTNPNILHKMGSRYQYYVVKNPQRGEWKVRLYATYTPAESTSVTVRMGQIP